MNLDGIPTITNFVSFTLISTKMVSMTCGMKIDKSSRVKKDMVTFI